MLRVFLGGCVVELGRAVLAAQKRLLVVKLKHISHLSVRLFLFLFFLRRLFTHRQVSVDFFVQH